MLLAMLLVLFFPGALVDQLLHVLQLVLCVVCCKHAAHCLIVLLICAVSSMEHLEAAVCTSCVCVLQQAPGEVYAGSRRSSNSG